MMFDTIDAHQERIVPLLPESARLLSELQDAAIRHPDKDVDVDALTRSSYLVHPEVSVPFLKFHVVEADEALLRFTSQVEPGFEVLQVHCAGFRYHWRSDLARAFEEQVPIFGRVCVLMGEDEFVVEHLALPILVRHRVRAMRGWFTFSRDVTGDLCDAIDLSIVRRSLRSAGVRLPHPTEHPRGRRSTGPTTSELPLSRPSRQPWPWGR